jgi:hypothetical protein
MQRCTAAILHTAHVKGRCALHALGDLGPMYGGRAGQALLRVLRALTKRLLCVHILIYLISQTRQHCVASCNNRSGKPHSVRGRVQPMYWLQSAEMEQPSVRWHALYPFPYQWSAALATVAASTLLFVLRAQAMPHLLMSTTEARRQEPCAPTSSGKSAYAMPCTVWCTLPCSVV